MNSDSPFHHWDGHGQARQVLHGATDDDAVHVSAAPWHLHVVEPAPLIAVAELRPHPAHSKW
jgi:hypothetical protein